MQAITMQLCSYCRRQSANDALFSKFTARSIAYMRRVFDARNLPHTALLQPVTQSRRMEKETPFFSHAKALGWNQQELFQLANESNAPVPQLS